MTNILLKLPSRFQFTAHKLLGHPLSEIFFQMGLEGLSSWIHDVTLPGTEEAKTEGPSVVSEEDRVWFREGGRALADARARYGAPFRLRGSGRWDDPGWGEVGEDPPMDVFEDLWGGGAW